MQNATWVGEYQYACSFGYRVVVSGEYAYLASYCNGFDIVDVTDKSNPVWAGGYQTRGASEDVVVRGNLAYIASNGYGLEVIDVANPQNPVLVGGCPTFDEPARRVVVSGNYAYIAIGLFGLKVIDIRDLENMVVVGECEAASWAYDMDVSGDHVYVGGTRGLDIIDVSDPEDPIAIVRVAEDTWVWGLDISGDCVYLARHQGVVQVIDVTNPVIPSTVGEFTPPGYCRDVVVVGDRAYVAASEWGLVILHIGKEWPVTSDVKRASDGALGELSGAIVTAAFPDFFYVESDDRSSGIRVESPGHTLFVGTRATVIGTVETNANGERFISAHTLSQDGSGSVDPVAIANRAIGGGDFFYDSETGAGQQGMTGCLGLNNVGMLVSTCGMVTERNPAQNPAAFDIDDGSASGLTVLVPDGVVPPNLGEYVTVTGLVSCKKTDEQVRAILLTRSQNDVVLVPV